MSRRQIEEVEDGRENRLQSEKKSERPRTHPQDVALLDEARQFLALAAALPEAAGALVGRDVDGLERDLVGLEDRLEPRGRGDDVRAAGRERGVEEEAGVFVEGGEVDVVGHGWAFLAEQNGLRTRRGTKVLLCSRRSSCCCICRRSGLLPTTRYGGAPWL
nr:hypothetical protein CFP56_22201 [Quercus suber]